MIQWQQRPRWWWRSGGADSKVAKWQGGWCKGGSSLSGSSRDGIGMPGREGLILAHARRTAAACQGTYAQLRARGQCAHPRVVWTARHKLGAAHGQSSTKGAKASLRLLLPGPYLCWPMRVASPCSYKRALAQPAAARPMFKHTGGCVHNEIGTALTVERRRESQATAAASLG